MKLSSGGRFEEIDVLRGFAAACVMLSHYSSYCVRYFANLPNQVDHYGFYAVQLFFIISGFVIYFTLEKCSTLTDFVFLRASRLYPVYWAALTLVTLVEAIAFQYRISPSSATASIWLNGYIVNLTMLQEFLGFPNFDNVFWSLTVEVAFYFDMALLFSAGLLGRIEIVGTCWLILACLSSSLEQRFGIALPDLLVRWLILPYTPFFVIGIISYRIHSRGATWLRSGIILAALLAEWWMHGAERLGIAITLCAIFGLALSGKLRFLVSPLTLWLGTISYPLYLIHRNLGYSTILRLHESGVPTWIVLTVTIAGALALATVLCYAVERPALRILRHWYRTATAAV